MKLLLDTHAVLWWWLDSARLPKRVLNAIVEAEEVHVSAVSAMEITYKHRLGKLTLPPALIGDLFGAVAHERFLPLWLTFQHAQFAGALASDHRDPFDRLLIAQATIDGLTLVSNEVVFDKTGVQRLW